MKSLLLVLILSFTGKCYSQSSIKSISVLSKKYEEIFDIKITNEENNYKIKNCDNSEFLNLNEMYLRTIPYDVIRSDAIRHISIQNNFLKKIPYSILDQVTYLSCFNLSRNYINLYEDNSIRHPYLRILDLSHQKITDVNTISKVETFDEETEERMHKHMIFNSIKIELPNLEYLDLSGNDISTLLWEFNMSFPKLVRLDLMNINAEVLEPNFFDKISTLVRILHLENNYLRNLTLRNVAEITALYLDGNPLEKLNITSTKLQTLSLSNCTKLRMTSLNIPYLEKLDLSKNNLNNMDSIYYEAFHALRILLLDYNQFLYIPILSNMQWLNELSLSYNMIKYIEPNSFEYLISLNKLSLRGNRIDRLERETFSGLEKLEYLDLSENLLSYLPSDWALPLIKLQYLNINSNQFASITEMGIYSVTSLQHLFIKNNKFTKITTLEIQPLPDFITIYLV